MKTVYKSTEISRENKGKTRKKRDFCIQCVNLHVKTVKNLIFREKLCIIGNQNHARFCFCKYYLDRVQKTEKIRKPDIL